MELVELDEARLHLRVDSTDEDIWITGMISAVSQAVLLWLKQGWRAYELAVDSNGDVLEDAEGNPIPLVTQSGCKVVKPVVKAAVLVELAQQYRFRDGSGAAAVPSHWGHGFVLGAGATSLLAALRKSTLA